MQISYLHGKKQMTSWPCGQIPSFLYHWLSPGKRRGQILELIAINTLCVLLQVIRYLQIFRKNINLRCYILENHFGNILNAQKSEKKILQKITHLKQAF